MNSSPIFNTPLELGLRSLYLLNATYPSKCSLERLIYLDYFTIYTKDSKVSLESLHPNYPLRAIELFSKREAIKKGLLLMASRGLINIECDDIGFSYSANIDTDWFLQGLSDEYSIELKEKASLVERNFSKLSDINLKNFVDTNIKSWGSEYNGFFPYKEEV
jgi:hypothetical protein